PLCLTSTLAHPYPELPFVLFFFSSSCPHPSLLSFPTRRSSDLDARAGRVRAGRHRSRLRARGTHLSRSPSPRDHRSDLVSGKDRSEEHTSELQSRFDLVCRLLLEKKHIN